VAEVCASVEIGEETVEICDDDAVTVRVPTLTILKDRRPATAGSDPKLGPLARSATRFSTP
jgi:hypothetical protein